MFQACIHYLICKMGTITSILSLEQAFWGSTMHCVLSRASWTQGRESEAPGCHILTHPDFAKLPRPKFPDQLERLPGDFPLILGPGVLRSQAHTGLGQPLA